MSFGIAPKGRLFLFFVSSGYGCCGMQWGYGRPSLSVETVSSMGLIMNNASL